MRAYSNKSDRTNPAKCLYGEIRHDKRGRKKAARRDSKKITNHLIQ